ncbi:MAG: FHA domain-containing protein [Planctomycetaceae bacterium]|jgi:pSer/pThr/pTyr-binding forkhead associated (FHA) protein
MPKLTIQILEGVERGRIYDDLTPPITIGREEENRIQLNDDRVSRFHLKIQEEAGRVILTDLDSTNGTRVNGHPIQVRVLQPGDQILVGRSLLLYGSPQELRREDSNSNLSDHALDNIRTHPGHPPRGAESVIEPGESSFLEARPVPAGDPGGPPASQTLFPAGPPILPEGLRMGQSAQLHDLLVYVHREMSDVVANAKEESQSPTRGMLMGRTDWQRLQLLQMQVGRYIRQIIEP